MDAWLKPHALIIGGHECEKGVGFYQGGFLFFPVKKLWKSGASFPTDLRRHGDASGLENGISFSFVFRSVFPAVRQEVRGRRRGVASGLEGRGAELFDAAGALAFQNGCSLMGEKVVLQGTIMCPRAGGLTFRTAFPV